MSENKFKLDDYFGEARRQDPAMSKEEARNLIDGFANAGSASQSHLPNSKTNILTGVNKMNILTAAITVAAAVGTLTVSQMNVNDANPALQLDGNATEYVKKDNVMTEIPEPALKAVSPEETVSFAYNNDNKELYASSNSNDEPKTQETKKIDIKGVRFVELSPEELKELGVEVTDDCELRFLDNWSSNPMVCRLNPKGGLIINTNDKPEDFPELKRIVSPRLITDNKGNKRMMWFNDNHTHIMNLPEDSIEIGFTRNIKNFGLNKNSINNLFINKNNLKINIDSMLKSVSNTKIPHLMLDVRNIEVRKCDSTVTEIELPDNPNGSPIIIQHMEINDVADSLNAFQSELKVVEMNRVFENIDTIDGLGKLQTMELKLLSPNGDLLKDSTLSGTIFLANRIGDVDKMVKKFNIRLFKDDSSASYFEELAAGREALAAEVEKQAAELENKASELEKQAAELENKAAGLESKVNNSKDKEAIKEMREQIKECYKQSREIYSKTQGIYQQTKPLYEKAQEYYKEAQEYYKNAQKARKNTSSSKEISVKMLTLQDEVLVSDLKEECKIIESNKDIFKLLPKNNESLRSSMTITMPNPEIHYLNGNDHSEWTERLNNLDCKLQNYEADIDKYIKINKIVPVKINMNCKDDPDFAFILWYEATPEFIAALPENERVVLEREIKTLQDAEQICEAAPKAGENTYLDLWRSCSGVVENLAAFPNPATDRVNITFNLLEDRVVKISLHDLYGRKIQDLMTNSQLAKGERSLSIFLKGVSAGMYLISLETDKGETAVQRLVVE